MDRSQQKDSPDDKDGKYDEKFGLARCAPLARSIESWETLHSLNLQVTIFADASNYAINL